MKYLSIFLLFLSTDLIAQTLIPDSVHTMKLSAPIPGMGRLGGVSVDRLGIIYVADFRDKVWQISPSGERMLLAEGLYGASGNTIDSKGNIIQSNFLGNSVVRIDRSGNKQLVSDTNLNGPVGISVDNEGNMYVCNCTGNSLTKIDPSGASEILAQSDLFNCPNGIAFGSDSALYVTNYHNDIIIRVTREGEVSEFTTVSGGQGNAHIAYSRGDFYVTKIKANTIHRVTPDGNSFLLAGGLGQQGLEDGEALSARFAQPNGIAVDPFGSTLYVNTLNGPWVINRPGIAGTIDIRVINIQTITEIFDQILRKDGLEAATAAYWAYRESPEHQHEDTGLETSAYAWQLMIERKITEAIQVFSLLSETYPDRWRPYYYLGQVFTMIGQPDQAKKYYKTALAKDPGNTQVEIKLNEL